MYIWFQVGQAKIVRESPKDKVLLIGSGITLHESLAAANKLKEEGMTFILYIYKCV